MTLEELNSLVESNLNKQTTIFNNKLVNVLKKAESLIIVSALDSNPLNFDMAVQQALRDSGYYKLVDDFIDNSYDSVIQAVKDSYAVGGIGVTFSKDDLNEILALKNMEIQAFRDIGNQTATNLKKSLYKYSLSNLSKSQIISNIRRDLALTPISKYSYTYANTSIAKFQQSLVNLKAKESKGVWIYQGVNDDLTRSFCKCILNQRKYYTDSEKNKLENDSRREWNCRHMFYLVDEKFAIEEGYTKGSATC